MLMIDFDAIIERLKRAGYEVTVEDRTQQGSIRFSVSEVESKHALRKVMLALNGGYENQFKMIEDGEDKYVIRLYETD